MDFDPDQWGSLPPLDETMLPCEPPPERDWTRTVTIGSDLEFPLVAADIATDLGLAVHHQIAQVHPDLPALARLGATDPTTMPATARVDALIMIDRLRAWLDAQQIELLALISLDEQRAEHGSVEEVGAALRLSGPVAYGRLKNAEQLYTRLPDTLQSLTEGRISAGQAAVIANSSFDVTDDKLAGYEQRVLAHAPEQSLPQTRQAAKRAQLAADPATADIRHRRAVADRHVRIAPAEDGMAWLIALLPAADAHTCYGQLDAAARTVTATEPRTMDQLRADALIARLAGAPESGTGKAAGRSPIINVTVSLATLTGRDDEPGWLDNYGPIPASYARQLAHDPTGTWRRLVTDPVDGQLLDYGKTRYTPPRHLGEHIVARDGTCTFPFCNHSARNADLDHIEPYPNGPTSAENLQPLHRRHHNAKTHGGWRAERDPDTGATRWISPQGRPYRSRPPQRWTLPDEPPP